MAVTSKPLYASSASFTITLASLANNAARQSAAISNTVNLYEDALVLVTFNIGTGSPSSSGVVNVYAVGSVDGGTTYTAGASGTDSGFTMPSNSLGLPLLAAFPAVTASTTITIGPLSIASAFGGRMPDHWALIVENKSGVAASGTEAPTKTYLGVNTQYV